MKELFDNSKFGDKFKTRDGRIALYIGKTILDVYYFIIESRNLDDIIPIMTFEDGRVNTQFDSKDDIVEEFKPTSM